VRILSVTEVLKFENYLVWMAWTVNVRLINIYNRKYLR